MNQFLFRPHVHGVSGITTPDLLIDRVALNQAWLPIRCISSAVTLDESEMIDCHAAIVLCSAGGGTLIAPALVCNGTTVTVARQAWRFADTAKQLSSMTLNETPVRDVFDSDLLNSGLSHSNEAFRFVGVEQMEVPRGRLLVLPSTTKLVAIDGRTKVVLRQNEKGLSLTHNVGCHSLFEAEQLSDVKPSIYAIGPTQKTVEHYNISNPE